MQSFGKGQNVTIFMFHDNMPHEHLHDSDQLPCLSWQWKERQRERGREGERERGSREKTLRQKEEQNGILFASSLQHTASSPGLGGQ